jgi:hypothetical protein
MLVRPIAGLMIAAPIAIALTGASITQSSPGAHATKVERKGTDPMAAHGFVGMWVTADGYIRHELLPNGRYDEAHGSRNRAYQGRYTITGNHIDYVDDTGFTADDDFIDDVLHHAGMLLYRAK